MKLYEIPTQYRQILEATVDEETGEILDLPALESFREDAEAKIEATACFMKELKADVKALADQIEHLKKRKEGIEKHHERLAILLGQVMLNSGITSVKTPQISVSARKTDKVFYAVENPDMKFRWQQLLEDHPELFTASYRLSRTAFKDAALSTGEIPEEWQDLISVHPSSSVTIR